MLFPAPVNAACRGRVDGSTASPSTTNTNPESAGSVSTPAGGGSLVSDNATRARPLTPLSEWIAPDPGGTRIIGVNRLENTIAFPFGSVLPPPTW